MNMLGLAGVWYRPMPPIIMGEYILICTLREMRDFRCQIMKRLTTSLCLLMLAGTALAQKPKIFRTKVFHFDHSSVKGIVYDVNPQGIVLLDPKTVSAMSPRDIRESVLKNQLPTFTVPFDEVASMNIRRRRSSARGFGLGYLASFVTLETVMAASALSQDNGRGCGGSRQKLTLGDALISASCAAPPGILVMGVVSVVGGGIGSIIGAIPKKQIRFDPKNQEVDAREKLKNTLCCYKKSATTNC